MIARTVPDRRPIERAPANDGAWLHIQRTLVLGADYDVWPPHARNYFMLGGADMDIAV